jgi:internalin A
LGEKTRTGSRPWWSYVRFRLRLLIAIVLLIGASLGWIVNRVRVQREAVAAIRSAGGQVFYDWEWKNRRLARNSRVNKPRGPKWLLDRLGVDYFNHIVYVSLTEPASDEIMAQIGQLNGLEILWLPGSRVTDTGLSHLNGLTRLRTLVLLRTPITDAGLAHLEGLYSLEQLYLGETAITDAGLAHLKGLYSLEELYLRGTAITDAGLAHLKGLSRLKKLDLSMTQVRGAGLAHLGVLKQLDTLSLVATGVDDDAMVHVANLAGLRSLNLTNDTRVSSAGLGHLKRLEGLQDLRVRNVKFTSGILEDLRSTLPKLKMDY